MAKIIHTDICVIGGGAGGLSVAAGAVQMGAETVLIERGKMGGDCLNTVVFPLRHFWLLAKRQRRQLVIRQWVFTRAEDQHRFWRC